MDKLSRSRDTGNRRLDSIQKNPSSSNRGGRIGDFATLPYQQATQKHQETERQSKDKRKALALPDRKGGRRGDPTLLECQRVALKYQEAKQQSKEKGKAPAPPDRKDRFAGRTISGANTSSEKQCVLSNAHYGKKGHSGIYDSGLENGCLVDAAQMMLRDQGIYRSDATVAQEVDYDPSSGAYRADMLGPLNRYGNASYEYVDSMDTTQLQEALEHGPVGSGFRRANGNLHAVVIDRVTRNVHYRDGEGYYTTPKGEWDSVQEGGYIAQ